MTNPYTDKAADLVTKLFRTGEHINGTVVWEPTEMVATALQEAADEALERAIGAAEEYEIWNVDNDYDLGRSETATAILEDIRALKSPKGEE